MTERRITVADGIDLAVVEAGAGGRPLLLMHGFGGAKEDFTGFLDPLAARGWHAVTFDLRGHGSSSKSDDESAYGFDLAVGDVLALADALRWERFTLLGHSMGGMIAQLVALKAPERLDALILMDTSHACPDRVEPNGVALGIDIVRQGGTALLVDIQRQAGPSLTETAAHLRMVAADPAYDEFSTNKTLATHGPAWIGFVRDILDQEDRLPLVASLRLPTLVIAGEQDDGFTGQCGHLADTIPGARLEVIPDGGHSPQFEAPEAWWAALTSFLDDLPTTGGSGVLRASPEKPPTEVVG